MPFQGKKLLFFQPDPIFIIFGSEFKNHADDITLGLNNTLGVRKLSKCTFYSDTKSVVQSHEQFYLAIVVLGMKWKMTNI